MKTVKVKAPWFDAKGLHKIGDVLNVETAAFNPHFMEEVEEKAKVAPVDVEPEKVDVEPEKPAKTTKTTKKTTKKG